MTVLAFVDIEPIVRSCALDGCGVTFTVPFPSTKKRYCSYSCSAKSHAHRPGQRNANWRGGKTAHPLYDVYMDMVGRCGRPTHHAFERYGGRGIAVCDRWRADFWNFVADVGERPEGRSMDRIDNDGPYAPGNFRWATHSEQQHNRRNHAHVGRTRNEIGQFA